MAREGADLYVKFVRMAEDMRAPQSRLVIGPKVR